MKRAALPTLIVLVASAIAGAAPADDDRAERTAALFEPWDRDDGPGCAVAVIRDGAVVFGAGYGQASLEHDAPIEPDTIFHIASVSKQFVAFAVCLLAADGAVTLDDDIREHVPEVPDFGPTLTLRHLVHHVSGIRDQWDLLTLAGWRMEDVITRDDAMALIAAQRELNFEPGTRYAYSNTGYTLLGLVVERVSGRSLDAFCQERVFGPLGMTRTHFHDDHRHIVPGRAECYAPTSNGYEKVVLSYAIAGATSLFTTVEDLARWEENFYTGAVGGPGALDLMEQRFTLPDGERTSYGMGIVHGDMDGRPTRGHGGADAGFRSYLVRFPEDHLSVAILANMPMPTGDLARRAARVWLGTDDTAPGEAAEAARAESEPGASPPPAAVQLDRERLEHLAGRYASQQPPIVVELRAADDGLAVKLGDQGPLELVPESATRFRLEGVASGLVEFSETNGSVTSMTVSLTGGATFVLQRMSGDGEEAVALADYAGIYDSPELMVRYELLVQDDRLMLKRRKHGTVPLLEVGPDHYGGPFRIRFERNGTGAVTGFRVTTGRVWRLLFERVP